MKITQPLLKWSGGKTRELPYILPRIPTSYLRYIEPFAGGASVFHSQTDFKSAYLNDLSKDLIHFYENIKHEDKKALLIQHLENIDHGFLNTTTKICNDCHRFLSDTFNNAYLIAEKQSIENAVVFCKKELQHLPLYIVMNVKDNQFCLDKLHDFFLKELVKVTQAQFPKLLKRKMLGKVTKYPVENSFLTIFKSAFYNTIRQGFNFPELYQIDKSSPCYSALYLFIRQYAFSAMHRFNANGEFNVPYGGTSYNNQSLKKKIENINSESISEKFEKTFFSSLDFETFLNQFSFAERDFIFLDPSYDSPFSTYDKTAFNREDHQRLANFLISCNKAKWLLVINKTDFIHSLYRNKVGIYIDEYDKNYSVNIKNRNQNQAIHLMIRNYP